jgi:Glyoxalase/Bleomycin resistance protein/Dioxygenase superfamily
MFTGAHFLLYSKNPEADRGFLRDTLGFQSVDAGGGWLIFALPPAELAVHPVEGESGQRHAEHQMMGVVLYLMCEDLDALMRSLEGQGVSCGAIQIAEWGRSTALKLPSGGEIGLYQPTHATALHLSNR